MSESKKLQIGKELTDDELMEMTGGARFRIACQKNYTFKPFLPVVEYGVVITDPEIVVKYGVDPGIVAKYGIGPMQPLYGIKPGE